MMDFLLGFIVTLLSILAGFALGFKVGKEEVGKTTQQIKEEVLKSSVFRSTPTDSGPVKPLTQNEIVEEQDPLRAQMRKLGLGK